MNDKQLNLASYERPMTNNQRDNFWLWGWISSDYVIATRVGVDEDGKRWACSPAAFDILCGANS